jgi:hypothetical protein
MMTPCWTRAVLKNALFLTYCALIPRKCIFNYDSDISVALPTWNVLSAFSLQTKGSWWVGNWEWFYTYRQIPGLCANLPTNVSPKLRNYKSRPGIFLMKEDVRECDENKPRNSYLRSSGLLHGVRSFFLPTYISQQDIWDYFGKFQVATVVCFIS